MLGIGRRIYYMILGYSSRLTVVPRGFHGFGCYRQAVLEEALRYGTVPISTSANACQASFLVDYVQAERLRGLSSYRGLGYWPEALSALASGDAAASRLALFFPVRSRPCGRAGSGRKCGTKPSAQIHHMTAKLHE